MGAYGRGIKLGKFVNNYLYKDEHKPSREERQQIREDNAYIMLYGKDQFNKMTEYERKSRGNWNV